MSFKLLFFLFIFFPFSIQKSKYSEFKSNKTKTKIIFRNLLQQGESSSNFNLIWNVTKFALNYAEKNNLDHLIYTENFTKCLYEGILEHLDGGDMIETCMIASGKTLNDFGNEFECDSTFQSESQYITLHFSFIDFSTISSEENRNILDFLENYHTYVGFCIPKKCVNAVKELLQSEPLLNKIRELGNITDFKVNVIKEEIKKAENTHSIYLYILGFYLFFNTAKVIIGIIRVVWMNKGYKQFYVSKICKTKRGTIASIADDTKKKKDKEGDKINDDEEEDKKPEQEDENSDKDEKKDKNELRDDLNQSSLLKEFNSKNEEFSSLYNKNINNTFSDEVNLYNPFVDTEKEFPKWLKIMKSFDFFDNVNILCVLSNRYYNSFQIKRLYLIRFVIMIMCIVYQIIYSQLDLPYRYYIKNNFYRSPLFIIIKCCINSSTFWITLDAVIVGYKMMCFMKKEKKLSGNIQFLGLSKFLLLIIPKFITFFFAFVFFHIFSTNLTFEICKRNKVLSSYLYYKDTLHNRTFSVRDTNDNFWNLYKNFIPFRLNYIDFIKTEKKGMHYEVIIKNTTENGENETNITSFDLPSVFSNDSNNDSDTNMDNETIIKHYYKYDPARDIPSPFLTNTELFINVYFNEFYVLIIMTVITYYSYKLRNKIYDYIILGINIFLYILPLSDEIINRHVEKKKNLIYTLRYVLGQYYTEKYTHFFINFYYFGFLIGVMKFYLDENISNQKKKKQEKEDLKLGYEFCQKIIIYLNKLKMIYKRIILLASIFIFGLISSSFYFLQLSEEDDKNAVFNNDMNNSIYYLFIYEKNLCGIFFFIFLIMYITYPKNSNIIELSERNGFIVIERISFCFFCSFKYLIYSQFCVFIIYIQISYMNLFLNTLGMFLIIFTFSLVNTTLIELPLRQLVKSIMNKDIEKRFENYYYKYGKEDNSLNSSIRST